MKKIVVYTCITNNYDWLLPPLSMPENIDYVCYTNSYDVDRAGWEVRKIPDNLNSLSAHLVNRYFKFFPHEYFSDYDWSIYIDGNLRILTDLSGIIDEMSQEGEVIGCPSHPDRSTIIEEVSFCKRLAKFSATDLKIIDNQVKDYLGDGMPLEQPLTENNFIVRKHSDPRVKRLMESWWENLEKYSKRDQISFPYVVWKSGIPIKRLGFAGSEKNEFIKKVRHRTPAPGILRMKYYVRARRVDGVFWRFLNFNLDLLGRLSGGKARHGEKSDSRITRN